MRNLSKRHDDSVFVLSRTRDPTPHQPLYAVRPLLLFSQLVSKVVIYNVYQRIEIPRDIDAELSKPGFRALMIILGKVKDT